MVCKKCKSDAAVKGKTYFTAGEYYYLCSACAGVKDLLPTNMDHLFFNPEASQFEQIASHLSEEQLNIFKARERRARGETLWS